MSYKSCSYFVHDYTSFAEEKFIYDFSLLDWSSLDNSDIAVNDHFNFFYEKTNTCIEQHVPKKKVTEKNLKLRTKLWINSDIQKLMSYRDKLFAKMVKSPSADNKYLYSKFRNCVISEQRKSKIEYYQNYFEKHKTNMKMLWTGIKSIINLKAKHQLSHIFHLKNNDSRPLNQ